MITIFFVWTVIFGTPEPFTFAEYQAKCFTHKGAVVDFFSTTTIFPDRSTTPSMLYRCRLPEKPKETTRPDQEPAKPAPTIGGRNGVAL